MTLIKVLKSKIHRATVTHANVEYEGSITIPLELMNAAGLHEYEAVAVWNISNGNRFETYVIKGEENSGIICVNGAAAHLVDIGNLIIIACFTYHDESVLKDYKPGVVFVDAKNRQKELREEVPGPNLPV